MDCKKQSGGTIHATPRIVGSKVSQIANIFQSKSTAIIENDVISTVHKPRSDASSLSLKLESKCVADNASNQITVVRTESHVARFNNARALFEKLGTDDSGRGRSNERIKRPTSVSGYHSTESLLSPLSSPTKSHVNGSVFVNNVRNSLQNSSEMTNNHIHPIRKSKSDIRVNGVQPEKPEKPERKLNSKELIEKQRNWTSHFATNRSNNKRYNSDPMIQHELISVNNNNDSREDISDSFTQEDDQSCISEPNAATEVVDEIVNLKSDNNSSNDEEEESAVKLQVNSNPPHDVVEELHTINLQDSPDEVIEPEIPVEGNEEIIPKNISKTPIVQFTLEQEPQVQPILEDEKATIVEFNLIDAKVTASALCNSSISEEDSGFLSSEIVAQALKEPDAALGMAYADDNSSDEEKRNDVEDNSLIKQNVNEEEEEVERATVAETMTTEEADNLLSSRIMEKKQIRALLSDEEAQEVVHLLSPSLESLRKDDSLWSVDSDSCIQRNTMNASSTTLEDSFISSSNIATEDTYASSHFGSQTGSESGLISERISSVGSFDDYESTLRDKGLSETDDESTYKNFHPEPMREVLEESGVHYFEDGHFWMEIPGIPEYYPSDEEDFSMPTRETKVKFSSAPIKIYSTFTTEEYDRRNEDVDPIAASAEYELEKRVEKLQRYEVELRKGPEGLGLSIIGMGVGADAGLEKLGIFVKTITEHGSASRDGRIQVNDQIIEVDGKSLVGVTQAYAASVLRNTSGKVKFTIGREKDAEHSEVAHLIRQSIQADREREEHRRNLEQRDDSSLTNSYCSSVDESCQGFSRDPSVDSSIASANPQMLRQLLLQNEQRTAQAEQEVAKLKARLKEIEESGDTREELAEKLIQSGLKLREVERSLHITKRDVNTYEGMLHQSQEQYVILERKYAKAKKVVMEFQQRESDLLHREEFYLQLLQEKDTEYNALVKALKDRIIQVEQELLETQKKAGLAVHLPKDNSNITYRLPIPQKLSIPPVRPLLETLGAEFSDVEESPDEDGKTATVERKLPVKDELDEAVPQHELLDVSASKSKADLAGRGGLANRQLPTNCNKRSDSLSNSSSECTLDVDDDDDEISCNNSNNSNSNSTRKTTRVQADFIRNNFLNQEQQGQLMHRSIPRTVFPMYASLPNKSHQQITPDPWVQTSSTMKNAHNRNCFGPPASLAEQLKQVLAERERRISVESETGVSMTSNEDSQNIAHDSSSDGKHQWQNSPGSSSGNASPGYGPSELNLTKSESADSSDGWYSSRDTSISSNLDKKFTWHDVPPADWSKEQVCQWLLAVGLENLVSRFLQEEVNGSVLLNIDVNGLKTYGASSEDKARFKRKLKDLKCQIQKERRNTEKEKREREKLQRKAEKLAEKANKRK